MINARFLCLLGALLLLVVLNGITGARYFFISPHFDYFFVFLFSDSKKQKIPFYLRGHAIMFVTSPSSISSSSPPTPPPPPPQPSPLATKSYHFLTLFLHNCLPAANGSAVAKNLDVLPNGWMKWLDKWVNWLLTRLFLNLF